METLRGSSRKITLYKSLWTSDFERVKTIMPWLFKKCCVNGCVNRVSSYAQSCCEVHVKERQRMYDRTQRDKDAARFYHNDEWKKLRAFHLRESPRCVVCGRPATTADHVRPMKSGGEGLSIQNLRSLCASCHSRRHKSGGWGKR